MSVPVTVLDYGIGNLLNVLRALEHCGAEATLRPKAAVLVRRRAPRPARCRRLRRRHGGTARARPSSRSGASPRWGGRFWASASACRCWRRRARSSASRRARPDGSRRAVPDRDSTAGRTRSRTSAAAGGPRGATWRDSLLADTPEGTSVYLVHSYAVVPDDPAHRLADCEYGGHAVCAAIARGRITGFQFHPEKERRGGARHPAPLPDDVKTASVRHGRDRA